MNSTVKIIVAVVGVFFIVNLIAFSSSWGSMERPFKLVIRELIKVNLFVIGLGIFVFLGWWFFMR